MAETDKNGSNDAGSSTSQDLVQVLSMQWLNLNRIRSKNIPATKSELEQFIKNVIKEHNDKILDRPVAKKKKIDQIDNDKPIYEPGLYEELEITGHFMQCFALTTGGVSRLSRQTQLNPCSSTNIYQLIFYYRPEQDETPAHIMALTAGNAWQVVRPHIDYTFPIKIVDRVGDPKNIRSVKRKSILNPKLRETRCDGDFIYSTQNLYYLVDELVCQIQSGSPLYCQLFPEDKEKREQEKSKKKREQEKNKEKREQENCLIEITTSGMVKIKKEINIRSQYPNIILLFSEYMRDVEENSNIQFDFLHFIQPTALPKHVLDDAWIKYIHSSLLKNNKEISSSMHLQHTKYRDFSSCDSFKISFNSRKKDEVKTESNPPEVKEIAKIVAENGGDNEQKFMNKIKQTKLICQAGNTVKLDENIMNYMEGQFQYIKNDKIYFRMKNMYYEVMPSYLGLLYEDFRRAVKNMLLEEDSQWRLPELWKEGVEEGVYNQLYMDKNNFLVLDRILPHNIESCDILRYTNNEAYIYHVKEGIDRDSRVTCSQIFNAAALIYDALIRWDGRETGGRSNYIETLWKTATTTNSKKEWRLNIQKQCKSITKDVFFDIFLRRKLTFVYAYATNEEDSLSEKLKESEKLEKDPEMIKKLKLAGYLDAQGRMTAKFISITNKQKFKLEGESRENLDNVYKQLSSRKLTNSTISMIELVNLAQDFKEKNFELKICEIRRKESPDLEQPQPQPGGSCTF